MNKQKRNKQLKKSLFTFITVLFGMLFISGCATTWLGTGVVMDKTYKPAGYQTVSWSKENQWQGECYELIIKEKGTNQLHTGCVSERVWKDAMYDHQITLTKDYS